MKRAVTFLLVNEDGKVLSVARRDDPDDWGLPGGKVEEGETDKEAIEREIREETGLNVIVGLTPIFTDVDGPFTVATYTHTSLSGELKPEDGGGLVDWRPATDVMRGCFGEYNRKLFAVAKVGPEYVNEREIDDEIVRASAHAKSEGRKAIQRARSAEDDSSFEARKEARQCPTCYYNLRGVRIVTHAFVNSRCQFCGTTIVNPNSDRAAICNECSDRYDSCVKCKARLTVNLSTT